MVVMLIKGLVYLVCGIVLVLTAELPRWASYAVGCWCGANAMGYLVSYAAAHVKRQEQEREATRTAQATILEFIARESSDGTTTH